MQLPLENLTWNGGDMVVCEEFETALYDLINSVTPWKKKMESWKEMIFIQSRV